MRTLLWVAALFITVNTSFAGSKHLFGIPYSNHGQLYTLQLLAATLPETVYKTSKKPMKVSWLSENQEGFGNMTYVQKMHTMTERNVRAVTSVPVIKGFKSSLDRFNNIATFPGKERAIWYPNRPESQPDSLCNQLEQQVKPSSLIIVLADTPTFSSARTLGCMASGYGWLRIDIMNGKSGDSGYDPASYAKSMSQVLFNGSPMNSANSFERDRKWTPFSEEDLHFPYLSDDESLQKVLDAPSFNLAIREYYYYSTPRFGICDQCIGFLLDDHVMEQVKQYNKSLAIDSSLLGGVSNLSPDFLQALTGEAPDKALGYFTSDPDFYMGYQSILAEKIRYLQTIIMASAEQDSYRAVYSINREQIEDPVFQAAMQKVNIDVIHYWHPDNIDGITLINKPELGGNWVSYSLTNQAEKGRSLYILNPYPLKQDAMKFLMYFSDEPVGTTGDHTLYLALSLGKLPFHEHIPHQWGVAHELAKISPDEELLNNYFLADRPSEKAIFLKALLQDDQVMRRFNREVLTTYNAGSLLMNIIRAIQPDSTLRTSLKTMDQQLSDEERLVLEPPEHLTPEEKDVWLGRYIVQLLRQDITIASLHYMKISTLFNQIVSTQMQYLLSELINGRFYDDYKDRSSYPYNEY